MNTAESIRTDDDEVPAPRSQWWALFGIFAVLLFAWSMALPPFSGTDEGAHSIRAAAAARGQWTGRAELLLGWQMEYRVPEGLQHMSQVGCFGRYAAHGALKCHPRFSSSNHLAKATSYEFRGFPAYYTLVGLPSLLPRGADVYRMRVLSALACAAFAASAVVTAIRRRNRAASILALALVFTPEVIYLGSIVNPSGLEIICSIVLFASLLALAGRTTESDATLVRRAGVALLVLVVLRSIDPTIAILALGSFVVIGGLDRARELVRRTDVRRWLAAAAALVVAHLVWVLTVGIAHQEHRDTYQLARGIGRWDDLLRESVGVFGSNDVRLPVAVYTIWAVVAVIAIAVAMALGTWRHRIVALTLLAGAWLLGLSVDVLNFPNIGFAWQGRYGLPIVVGAVLVALDGIRVADRPPELQRAFTRSAACAVAILLGTHVVSFMSTGARYGTGKQLTPNVFWYVYGSDWNPKLPSALLLVAMVGATVALAVVLGRAMLTEQPTTVRA